MKSIFHGKKKTVNKGSDIAQSLIESNSNETELQPQIRRDENVNRNPMNSYVSPTPIPRGGEIRQTSSITSNNRPVKEGYKWDFCIVVPNPEYKGDLKVDDKVANTSSEHKMHHEEILERIHLGGLETYQFYSGDNDEIFIKVHASLERLQNHAENTGFRMLMDEKYLEQHVDDTSSPIADDPDLTRLSPYEYIYGKYDTGIL
jgi:hypothetical protein